MYEYMLDDSVEKCRKLSFINQDIVSCLFYFAKLLHIQNVISGENYKMELKKHSAGRDKSPIKEIKLANHWNLEFDGQTYIENNIQHLVE